MKHIALEDDDAAFLECVADDFGSSERWDRIAAALDAAEDAPAPPADRPPTFGPWVAHNGGARPDSVPADAMVQVQFLSDTRYQAEQTSPVLASTFGWDGSIACYRVQRAPVREVIGLYHRGEREPFATVVFIDGKADWTTVRTPE